MKKISTLLLCVVLAAALALAATAVGCKSSGTDKPNENQGDNDMNNDKIIATIEMENGGVMKLELYPEIAPQSVYNFVSLARSGFYNGLTFHRIIPGFMIQGGDPLGEGYGGPGYSIKGEFASNGFNNTLKHERGVISWARLNNPDSAGSQFFIMHAAAPHLDGSYAAFGRVIEGIEVVDEIASVKTGANDRPVTPVVIKSITISGPELPEPDKLPGK